MRFVFPTPLRSARLPAAKAAILLLDRSAAVSSSTSRSTLRNPSGSRPFSARSAHVLRFESETGNFHVMTDKQAVIDALGRLPENASLDEITEELRIMAAIRRGRADVAAGRTKTHQEAKELVESWASAWTSK